MHVWMIEYGLLIGMGFRFFGSLNIWMLRYSTTLFTIAFRLYISFDSEFWFEWHF